jgi:branched-chain amino acid transport system substrate-binding protein
VLGLVLAVMTSACATRLSRSEIIAAHRRAAVGDSGAVGSASARAGGAVAPGSGSDSGTLPSGGTSGSSGGTGGTPTAVGTGSAGAPSASGGTGAGAAVAAKGKILLGSVGTISGIGGAAVKGGPAAVQAWVQMINAQGGINGYTFEVIVRDDGGDPARYQAAIKDLVENHKVFAFVSNMAPFTLDSAKAYLEQKGVPVIGGDNTQSAWNSSPMFFPQGATADTAVFGMPATVARLTKFKRFGGLTCQEAAGCTQADKRWFDDGWIQKAGLQPGYRGHISLAQPDFTAECLRAKSDKTEALAPIVDSASILRIARDCARQGYRPQYVSAQTAIENKLATNNDGSLEGLLAVQSVFPWTLRNSPATQEFGNAMARYDPGDDLTAGHSQGWTAAKLLEKGFRQATAAGQPADRARLLDALYSMKGETLDGLAPPLTFVRGKPAPRGDCWFVTIIAGHSWVSDGKPVCAQVPA